MPVPPTLTTRAGRHQLRISPQGLLIVLAIGEGLLDFEIIAVPSTYSLSTTVCGRSWTIKMRPTRYFYYILFSSWDGYGRHRKSLEMGEWWDGWDSNPGPKPEKTWISLNISGRSRIEGSGSLRGESRAKPPGLSSNIL
jgi:hypothetical protein